MIRRIVADALTLAPVVLFVVCLLLGVALGAR
jgi:hypothetical protein